MDDIWGDVRNKRKARNSGSKSPNSSSPASKKPNIAQKFVLPHGVRFDDEESDADETMETINTENTAEALNNIAAHLKTLVMNVTHIRKSQDNLTERIQVIENNTENNKSAITIVNDELSKYKKNHDELQKRVMALEHESQKLSSVIEKQDEQARRQNVMFFGVKEDDRETWDITEEKIRDLLENTVQIPNAKSKNELQIERAQRVGQRDRNRTRPVLVRFSQERQRSTVLEQARQKLKDTDIRVGEDLSKRVRDIRRKLYPKMMEARSDGKHAVIRYDKLYIDDVIYTLGSDNEIVRVGERQR